MMGSEDTGALEKNDLLKHEASLLLAAEDGSAATKEVVEAIHLKALKKLSLMKKSLLKAKNP